jgi:hypothetical protein
MEALCSSEMSVNTSYTVPHSRIWHSS